MKFGLKCWFKKMVKPVAFLAGSVLWNPKAVGHQNVLEGLTLYALTQMDLARFLLWLVLLQ